MTSPYTYAVKLSGGLLLAAVLSSCTLFPSSPAARTPPVPWRNAWNAIRKSCKKP